MSTTGTELVHQVSTVDLARKMADSTLLPRAYQKQPANLLFAFELADSIGIPRVNALTSIHVIDGKPTMSADLIASLVRKAGHKIRIEGDDTYAEVTIIRADDPEYVPKPIRWDEAKARQAGKWGNKGPWTNYPAAMLRARAITEAARMWASDALYGVVYSPEELGANVNEDGEPTAPTYVQNEAPQAAPEPAPSIAPVDAEPIAWADPDNTIDAIYMAQTPADLVAIGTEIKGRLREADRERVTAAYKARAAQLAAPAAEPEPEPEPTLDDAAATLTDEIEAEVVE